MAYSFLLLYVQILTLLTPSYFSAQLIEIDFAEEFFCKTLTP
jgi:hypothetical protein